MCKLCDNSHLSPSPVNERRVHQGMTALERAYQAPFGVLIGAQSNLLKLVEDHDASFEVGGGGGGIEMKHDWAETLVLGMHLHPTGPAEA